LLLVLLLLLLLLLLHFTTVSTHTTHRHSEEWLHTALTLLHWKGRELDPEGLASVATSLVQLSVVISSGQWLDGYGEPGVLALGSVRVCV
jgi:hypothetical protein